MEWCVRQGAVEFAEPARRESGRSHQGSGEAAIDRMWRVLGFAGLFLVLDLVGQVNEVWADVERERFWGNLVRTEDVGLVMEEVGVIGSLLRSCGEMVIVVLMLRVGM